MSSVRLALAQINPTVGDVAGNVEKVIANIEKARALDVDLVVFPELAICGYPPEDLLLKPSFLRACQDGLGKASEACRGVVGVVGYPELRNDLFNAAAVLSDGRITGCYRKRFLPTYGVFDEDRYFAPSFDNAVLHVSSIKIGITICEDMWYPAGPHAEQVGAGDAELLINISASPYHRGKGNYRERMLAVRAADSVAALAFCNLVGGQDELVFDGRSALFDPKGEILARGKQFAEDLVIADIDIDAVRRQRLHDPRRRKGRLQHPTGKTELKEIVVTHTLHERRPGHLRAHLHEPLDELEEIYQALVIGTRDYVKKNGFQKVIIGLSGGIDSSLVACIAADALGPENVLAVSLPSRFSSEHSKGDAAKLASALSIQYMTISIEPAHKAFNEMMAPIFSDRTPDLTEENLQSRLRGVILMALSNKFGWLVLTTGNKSENGVGYATLYGDMAGGYAVIKDVPKMLVYELGRHRNARNAVIPENVFTKPPSAELRPGQKDSDSLPEYAELDPILTAYVEQDWSIAEMVWAGFAPATVARVVELVDKTEYKRRQSPPGVKITPRAFGKDRRLPITNRFREEGV